MNERTPQKQRLNRKGNAPGGRLFSIGHSNHSWDRFIELLRSAGVNAVADVRSSPFSKWLPYFNRSELQRSLPVIGIEYRFLGEQLGGRPADPQAYDEAGRVNYERVRTSHAFQHGLDVLVRELHEFNVAMLCAEEDPLVCHRGLMITPALAGKNIAPLHIREDGRQETTPEMEERILAETGVGEGILDGLFAATLSAAERADLLADAYRKMAWKKAYRRTNDDES